LKQRTAAVRRCTVNRGSKDWKRPQRRREKAGLVGDPVEALRARVFGSDHRIRGTSSRDQASLRWGYLSCSFLSRLDRRRDGTAVRDSQGNLRRGGVGKWNRTSATGCMPDRVGKRSNVKLRFAFPYLGEEQKEPKNGIQKETQRSIKEELVPKDKTGRGAAFKDHMLRGKARNPLGQ